MLTRRELLALLGSSAALRAFAAEDVPFDRINEHTHIYRSIPALVADMEKTGWRALSICTFQAARDDEPADVEDLIRQVAKVHRESKGRIAWATTFDARGFESSDFAGRTIAGLRRNYDQGAIAVKIWKTIGMAIKSKSGRYLMPDDKTLLPIYESIQKEDRTLIAHLAEPNAAWLPSDDKYPHAAYYRNNPQWHMYEHPDAPRKEEILAARDRILARYPKLRVVGCHLGSNEEDLKALAGRLDRYPNFAVDVAARVQHFFDGDRESVRQFLEKYQDRILYGSDFTMGNMDDDRVVKSLSASEKREWNMFADAGIITFRNRQLQGLGLPDRILRKIFHDNAVRWIPGIA
jgi:hypothetical protein